MKHLIDRIASAAAHNQACAPEQAIKLKIRGSGSKDFYTQNPSFDHHPVEPLNTCEHSGITSHEPSELYVTARCGTPLVELEAALAEQHQCLAFEPPHFANLNADSALTTGLEAANSSTASISTVGGMVAAGLSGPARASAGSVRDHVLGITLINGQAQVLHFGGTVMKNVAGYDMSRILAGSLGQLGLIAEVSLKVLPLPAAEATLRCTGLSQAAALELLHGWGAKPLPLNASTWLPDEAGTLYLRLRGAVAAVQSARQSMRADALAVGAALTESDFSWATCRDQTLNFFNSPSAVTPEAAEPASGLALWRLSVPQTAPVLDLQTLGLTPAPQCIEWQGAQRWLWASEAAAAALRQWASSVGGHASIFRRPSPAGPLAPHVPRFSAPSAPIARINQKIKSEFDPAHIFYSTEEAA
jgi:glycolate oxidase FAD binding subunit